MNVIARELITLGAIIDMKKNTHIIYMNYIGYDEISHHRGPPTKSTYRVVRALDRNIKRIFLSKKKDYDIFILSDHGHTQSIPFKRIYRQELSEFVNQLAKVSVTVENYLDDKDVAISQMEKDISEISKQNILARLILPRKEKQEKELDKKFTQITIEVSSCLAHIYFMYHKERLDKSQIEARFPEFIEKLVLHPGIGFAIVKHESNLLILTKTGEAIISEKGVVLRAKNKKKLFNEYDIPLNQYPILFKHIAEMATKNFAGDIIIQGSMKNNIMISFADHFGTHGGFGGNQNNAFIISKQNLKTNKMYDAKDLNKFFKKTYKLK